MITGTSPTQAMVARAGPAPRSTLRAAWKFLIWAYFAALMVVWAAIGMAGDRWWWGTLLIFAPRWIWGLPLLVLVPAAIWSRSRWRLLWVLLWAAGVQLVGIQGFTASWRGLGLGPSVSEPGFRVMTLNAGLRSRNLELLADLVARERPDVLMLQEWNLEPERTRELFPDLAGSIHRRGELTIASRLPVEPLPLELPDWMRGNGIAALYRMEGPGGPLLLLNVHLNTARPALEGVLLRRLAGVGVARANLEERDAESAFVSDKARRAGAPIVVAGDFNLPPESLLLARDWSDFRDAHREAGLGRGRTWFSSWHGLRIDRVLIDRSGEVLGCRVGPDVGSDHRPVIADVRWPGRAP